MGEANTTWNETKKTTDQHGKEQEETETLTGHEEYFQIQFYLLGGKNSKLKKNPIFLTLFIIKKKCFIFN